MASPSQFLAALKGGGARPNRFEVVIDLPAFAGGTEEIRQIPFLVNTTNLPGSTLGVIEQPFRGRQIKIPGDRTFEEWETVFVNDTDFAIRDSLERWHNAMNSYISNTTSLPLEDIFSTVSAFQLDSNDRRIKEYTMNLAWPSIVAPIELAQDSNDVLETFSVTWQYSELNNGNST